MGLLLGILLISFLITGFSFIPFINVLYKWKIQRQSQKTRDPLLHSTPIFDELHKHKVGTPVGGGALVIAVTLLLFSLTLLALPFFWIKITSVYALASEIKIVLFTFIAFGILGLIDDVKKTFVLPNTTFFGLKFRHKLILEIVLALVVSFWLYHELRISIIHIPIIGVWDIGFLYIPFSAFVIVAFSNAFNITDGLDGLASGLAMIALTAFWFLSASILDLPLSIFIAVWLGAIIAFLYFNIYPARIFLGDVGALSFGATMAVIGLLLGKAFALPVIGGVFVLEVGSSLVQMIWKKYFHRKFFSCAPLHLWFQKNGWAEPKIVMRFWLLGILFAIFGLWLSVVK